MAADLAALGDHLGLHDVTVIGHDWGAVFGYVNAAASPEKVSALGIVEMALPGMGVMEQAMGQQPGGNFLWHMGFQSVPELPELLIQGKERPYLRWFFEHFAYDPSAITAADLDEYVAAISQVGSRRAGLAVYQEFFASADQVASRAMVPLTIPVRAYGGEACLGARPSRRFRPSHPPPKAASSTAAATGPPAARRLCCPGPGHPQGGPPRSAASRPGTPPIPMCIQFRAQALNACRKLHTV